MALHGAETIAAVIVEPVAGSAGVLPPPMGYLERLRAICDHHGILLIFDEVITGFGRLGAPFAAQYFGVTPDIMTMAKGITNAAIPMGAVAAKREIHDALMQGPPERHRALPRLHLFRPPGGLRRGAGDAGHLPSASAFRARRGAGAGRSRRPCTACSGRRPSIDIRNLGLMAAIELAPRARRARRARLRGAAARLPGRPADPRHRRHHRALAAADHQRGPDRRARRILGDVLESIE